MNYEDGFWGTVRQRPSEVQTRSLCDVLTLTEELNGAQKCYSEVTGLQPFKDEAQTALLKDPVRTAQ